MTTTIDGTTGIITETGTGDVSVGDDLIFTGTGNRITGDFSNATIANRVAFQSSTTNGATALIAIPNGTSTTASFGVLNTSDPVNTSLLNLIATSTEVGLRNAITGTGTYVPMTFYTGGSERMRITSGGDIGIGITSPSSKLDIYTASGAIIGKIRSAGSTISDYSYWEASGGSYSQINITYGNGISYTYSNAPQYWVGTSVSSPLILYTNNTERMRIDSSGNVGIGTSSPSTKLEVYDAGTAVARVTSGTEIFEIRNTGSEVRLAVVSADPMTFRTSNVEAMRITSDGWIVQGGTDTNPAANNASNVFAIGLGRARISTDNDVPIDCNRKTSDGTLIRFRQDGTEEGSISVSGNTVSYNAFAGSHWSQLSDGSKPEILRGTVMESINELVEWPGEPTSERLCRVKISDTAGSKKVYGVFMCWDEDWTATNDMLVTSVGAFICRVNGSVTVQEGDLLESNGDGTARVQTDDIIRSSTIGKVTCTTKTYEYADGSYCVPTVLYCG